MIEIIDLLKPKNGGSFKLIEDIDIAVNGYSSLADCVAHMATTAMIEAINAALSGKQDKLTTAQLAAVNSGITAQLVTQIGTNTTAIAGKASQADLTALSTEVANKADETDLTTATANLQAQIDAIVTPVTQDAEVQNARVGADGTSYQTLKARLDAEESTLNTQTTALSNGKVASRGLKYGYANEINTVDTWEQGYLNSDGSVPASMGDLKNQRIRTKSYISSVDKLLANGTYTFKVYKYNTSDTFVTSTDWVSEYNDFDFTTYKYKIGLRKGDGSVNITPSNDALSVYMLVGSISAWEPFAVPNEQIDKLFAVKATSAALKYGYATDSNTPDLWEQGYINSDGSIPATMGDSAARRIRTNDYIPTVEKLVSAEGYSFIVFAYDTSGTFQSKTDWISTYSNFDFTTYKYKITLRKGDGSTYNINPLDNFSDTYLLNDNIGALFNDGVNNITLWEQGYLDSDGSVPTTMGDSAAKRIRTIDYIPQISKAISEDGYSFKVFIYDSNYDFVESSAWITSFTNFDFANYEYKIVLRKGYGSDEITPENSYFKVGLIGNNLSSQIDVYKNSRFYRNIYFNNGYSYEWLNPTISFNEFSIDTTSDEFDTAMNALVSVHSDYITRTKLGDDASGTYPIYQYELGFNDIETAEFDKNKPKILLIASQHGYEKSAAMACYYLTKLLCEVPNNKILEFLKYNCKIVMIPLCNPYGFNQYTTETAGTETGYLNANNVNLNRAYDAQEDESEIVCIKTMFDNNKDAFFALDVHANGSTRTSSDYAEVNWLSMRKDIAGDMIYKIAKSHLSNVSGHICDENSLTYRRIGKYQTGEAVVPTASWYMANHESLSNITLELCHKFPLGSATEFDATCQKVSTELLVNYLGAVIAEFKATYDEINL